MPKEERLQLRVEEGLKDWFKAYSRRKGGMSSVLTSLLKQLQQEEADRAIKCSGG